MNSLFKDIPISNKLVLFHIPVNEQNEKLIEIEPIRASAVYLNGNDNTKQFEDLKNQLTFKPSRTQRRFSIITDLCIKLKSLTSTEEMP